MKKSSLFILPSVVALFVLVPQVFAYVPPAGIERTQNITINTPTDTPTPTQTLIQLKAGLNKLPNLQLGAKNTVTPTPTLGTKDTVTPTGEVSTTPNASGTAQPTVAAGTTASNAANTATAGAQIGGFQLKDLVTYGLIAAIIIILLAQSFWPKKKVEAPKEEQKP